MSALLRPAWPAAPRGPSPSVTRYPHRQPLEDWLADLALALPPRQQLLRLLPLVEAAFDADDRLALHHRLWALWREVDEPARSAALALLDGRFAPFCAWLQAPWGAATTWQALARAHLGTASSTASPTLPRDPGFVLALLAAQGQAGDGAGPAARWLALQARLALDDDPLDTHAAAQLGAQVVDAAESGAAPLAEAMPRLFELAVRSGDDALATATLAECVQGDALAALPGCWLRRWLEGAGTPLALAPAQEAAWLKPPQLRHRAWRAGLAASLKRAATRGRMQALEAALGQDPLPDAATVPAGPAWALLGALDGAYLLAERGELAAAAVAALDGTRALALPASAALARALGEQHLARGDLAAAARELARARRLHGEPASRHALARVLEAADPVAAAPLAALLRGGSTGGAGSAEVQAWQQVASALPTSPITPLAQAMCARLHLDGRLETGAIERRQDLPAADALWAALADDPGHAAEAAQRRADEPLQLLRPLHQPGPGREHLWVPPSGPANGELLIVFACLDSRHSFTQVRSLRRGLPGHHLLFLNNPEFDWYSDAVFDGLCTLVRERVLAQFRRERVSCYFGSMGGTGALKLALAFGFRALAFNPQVDLDLWAAFRPRQRPRLWAAQRHAQLADWPTAAFEAAPLALMVGSSTVDRLAFSVLVERWRACQRLSVIVEKFADPVHAGLLQRASQGPVPATVDAATRRLAALAHGGALDDGFTELPPLGEAAFWDGVDRAARLKLEIVRRDGRLYHRPSRACLTRD